jgi:hypothetical protein
MFVSILVVVGRARSRPSLHLSAGCLLVFQRIPCITNLPRSPCYLEDRQQTGVGTLSSIADVTNLSNRYPPERDFGYVVLLCGNNAALRCVAFIGFMNCARLFSPLASTQFSTMLLCYFCLVTGSGIMLDHGTGKRHATN